MAALRVLRALRALHAMPVCVPASVQDSWLEPYFWQLGDQVGARMRLKLSAPRRRIPLEPDNSHTCAAT
jgi:hypothetical protein